MKKNHKKQGKDGLLILSEKEREKKLEEERKREKKLRNLMNGVIEKEEINRKEKICKESVRRRNAKKKEDSDGKRGRKKNYMDLSV